MASVLDLVKHYQHAIEKYPNDEQKVLKCIDKLYNLNVTVAHLQETGVGRTVNALRKEPGNVGKAARSLVYKWKVMVAAEESDQEGDHNHDSSNCNGHGSGKDSDDNDRHDNHRNANSNKTEPTTHRQTNGDMTTKRKYQSSEEEEQDTKKYKYSDSNSKYKENIEIKKEPESNSDDHSKSDTEGSESESSESSDEEEMIPPHKIKREPAEHKSSSKHLSSNYKSDLNKYDTHSKKSEEEQLSKHRAESTHSSSEILSKDKSSSSKHKSSSEKENGSEKKHKSSEKDKKHKEERSSSKHKSTEKSSSSDKHGSSSRKSESRYDKDKKSSEKHSSKSDKHSSSSKSHKSDKEKHKSLSEKDSSSEKNKSSSSSKEKHSSSSKDHKSKDRSSSSKEKSSHDQKSEKHSSDSKSKSKSEKSERSSDKAKQKSSSSKSSSKHKDEVPKKRLKVGGGGDSDDGIGCESGASFAEALGMISPAKPKKKQPVPTKDTSPSDPYNEDLSPASLLAPTAKLAPLPKIEISSLPEISPNYKPRPPPKFLPHFTDEEAMNITMSSKNQRTKVYSGNKIIGKVSSLYELCVQVLQEHIDALEYTGGVPYEILKPVVDKATPQQLFMLEHYNPYLMEDTDHLWKNFCEKHFRCKKRQEMETWREMYMRCQEEQESKLKSLTANIKIAQEAKKAPIKQTKMAYVDSVVKPPRNIARKQAQHGTAHMATASPAARVAALAAAPNVLKGGVRAPPAPPVSSSTFNKPKKAPLMLKTLQFMRGRKR